MLDRADAILKLAVAIAVLIAALAFGYYQALYLPRRDTLIRAEAKAKEERLEQGAKSAQAAKARLDDQRRLAYRTCVSAASTDYISRWNASCSTQSSRDLKVLNACIGNGVDETYCRTTYRVRSPNECELPTNLAESYDADLKQAKELCLAEFDKGAGTMP